MKAVMGPSWTPLAAAASLLLAAALPGDAHGQRWTAEARGGELRYEAGPGLDASTAMAGLRYSSLSTAFAASMGVPLAGDDPLWGAVAGARRLSRSAGWLTFGVDLSADLYVQHDRTDGPNDGGFRGPGGLLPPHRPLPDESLDGWGASLGVRPLLAVGGTATRLELRAGGAAYRSEFAGETFERELIDVDAAVSWAPSPRFLLSVGGRSAFASEDRYDRVEASAAVDHGRGMLRVSAGRWLADGIDGAEWSAAATFDVTSRVALSVSARQTLFEPLLLVPERTSWGAGVSVVLSGPRVPVAPIPESYRDGRATIVLGEGAPDDGVIVRIAGDFTGWEPVSMERHADGWRYTLPLEAGVYNYAFVTEDGRWFVPEGHPGRKRDGFGGHVAVLIVEEAP